MAEQIMWAIKDPKGGINYRRLHDDPETCGRWFAGDLWQQAQDDGYRAIRVRVTEVQDA